MFSQFQPPQEAEPQGIFSRFAAPIMQKQNALTGMMATPMGGSDPLSNLFAQAAQYQALEQHGGPTNAAAASLPTGDSATRLTQKLINRGLPRHVAEAFVVNFKDESGLNPGINEANPIVPGSRGGFGLYQLTGPRRKQYEAYAAKSGQPLDSEDAQLDFLMQELRTTESRAAKSILGASSRSSAAQAIVNDFLRPAASHRKSRAARYSRL